MSGRLSSIWGQVAPILASVERPSRYIASEYRTDVVPAGVSVDANPHVISTGASEVEKSTPSVLNFCMIYPDTYELGQPNQAVRILVNSVNKTPGLHAERAFLPAVDMIEVMEKKDIPLFSLESCAPVKNFDAVGITLPHELCATNVLEVLKVAGIPIRSSERSEEDPIVIGGGPCAYNPEPYAPFFDVITIGEGEEATPETLSMIAKLRDEGMGRQEILRAIANIEGSYVPSLYESLDSVQAHENGSFIKPAAEGVPPVIQKRVFEGFAESDAWEPFIVPYMETVHDRLNVEVLRGCARGCRFCQAGMMYRPVRERSADNICSAVERGIAETGYEEVGLTSLSTTDHSQIAEILTRLNRKFAGTGVQVSIPSQRLDAFGVGMASIVPGGKRSSLTFAPEAGSQRLRDVINKNVTEEDLVNAVTEACKAGWTRLKLYFMIGLPSETDEDVIGIAETANLAFSIMRDLVPPDQRGKLGLNLSINVFVPKAQTPFQWDGQIESEEALRRVQLIKKNLRYKTIRVSYHEPKTSMLEAIMSRGGRDIAELVEAAWQNGARFDAWTEHFNETAWANAAEELGVDMSKVAYAAYEPGTIMPWDHISCGVSKGFLVEERKRAEAGQTTPDCTFDACSNCGACPALSCKNAIQGERSNEVRS